MIKLIQYNRVVGKTDLFLEGPKARGVWYPLPSRLIYKAVLDYLLAVARTVERRMHQVSRSCSPKLGVLAHNSPILCGPISKVILLRRGSVVPIKELGILERNRSYKKCNLNVLVLVS